MEFLEGHELSTLIRPGHPMLPPEAAEIIEQIALGLQAAHDQHVVHRDLKPANIFLVPLAGSGRVLVKILDFGISKAVDDLSRLTHTQSIMGTPHYMAPEQATGGSSSLDAKADQFSLAAIVYELLTGRMAFLGDGTMNVLYKVVHEMPPSFSALGIGAPTDLEAVVLRGLAKRPEERFPTVLAFARELKRTAGLASTMVKMPLGRAADGSRTLRLPTAASTTLGGGTGELRAPEESERTNEGTQGRARGRVSAGGSANDKRSLRNRVRASVLGAAVAAAVTAAILALALREKSVGDGNARALEPSTPHVGASTSAAVARSPAQPPSSLRTERTPPAESARAAEARFPEPTTIPATDPTAPPTRPAPAGAAPAVPAVEPPLPPASARRSGRTAGEPKKGAAAAAKAKATVAADEPARGKKGAMAESRKDRIKDIVNDSRKDSVKIGAAKRSVDPVDDPVGATSSTPTLKKLPTGNADQPKRNEEIF
jgi:serine/threonine-protein kinase